MAESPPPLLEYEPSTPRGGLLARWQHVPLYGRIVIALAAGLATGVLLGPKAAPLAMPARLVLRLLGALAPVLILVAIVQALMKASLHARDAFLLARLLLLNTVVAIGIGLLAANVLQPGRHAHLDPSKMQTPAADSSAKGPLEQFLDSVPDSLLRPLVENNIIGIIIIGVAFGIALRAERLTALHDAEDVADLAYRCVLRVLQWIIALVPLSVFGIVASLVGRQGFGPFAALGAFVAAVLLALSLQALWYLARIRAGSWVRPVAVMAGTRDALLTAFCTDSSTAAMPVTYGCLVERVGLHPRSASLGALIGTNFNNDGTALYEAMSALFVSQLIGRSLTLPQQALVVVTSIIASVGAAGIPEAGTVTMTLVFTAVHLPLEYIGLLLTVDWFLDRCRTVVNVMGDINVSCLMDGRQPAGAASAEGAAVPAASPLS